MFVSKGKYNRAEATVEALARANVFLLRRLSEEKHRYTSLIRQGVELQKEVTRLRNCKNGLTDEDIRSLLLLCHPDKHGGKDSATRITQKLLAMRDK